jgi:hypothetical protein
MDVDFELEKVSLKLIINFQYNANDCLFDAIEYLLKYSINSTMIQKIICCIIGTPEALECCRSKLNFEFLHDLHCGNANDT